MRTNRSSERRAFKDRYLPGFTPTILSIAISATAFSSGAVAQSEVSEEEKKQINMLEEIEVVGFRRSLQNSMDLKMSSDSIVEAVSAEDIGKLPDVSIAESLARLPGLAAQRLNGRSQLISLRGLGPDFSTALLNGRQQVSSSDNRSVEFDQYPSELLNGVVVYKTPDASLLGQGLAGTVDMRTVRPLEHGEQTIVGNVRYEINGMDALNDDADNDGERVTFAYIDQFLDDTLGVAFGYSHINTPTQGERFNAWGYPEGTDPVTGQQARLIGGAKPFVQSNTLERDAFIGVVEYTPSSTFSTSLDIFYSDFKETQLLRGIEIPLAWSSASLDSYTVENGFVTSGTFSNVGAVMRNDAEIRDSELYAVGWNTEFAIDDNWTAALDISHSKNDRVDQVIETYSGVRSRTDTVNFRSSTKGTVFATEVDYADKALVELTNVQPWGGDFVSGSQEGFYKQPASTDELTQIRLSAERELDIEFASFLSKVEVGLAYDTREKNKTTLPEYFLDLADGAVSAPIPVKTSTTDLDFLGIRGMVSYDPLDVFESGVYDLSPDTRAITLAKSWAVEEDVTTAYVQMGVDTLLGAVPVTGNFGLQIVHSDQRSDGFAATGDEPGSLFVQPVSGGKTYTDFLPSLNLNFEVGEQKFVRLGIARTLARARMDELRISREIKFDSAKAGNTDPSDSPWTAEGGNPELDPWVANSIDLTYEQYFEDGLGYFSIATFYKDLRSFIFTQPQLLDFSGFPTDGSDAALTVGTAKVPQNGEGGSISGFELSLSLAGEMFTPVLEGFGTTFSASYTESEIQPNPDDDKQPLPGLSEDVYNLTVYYEKYGFSARVSGRYRSDFLGELSGFDARRTFRYVDEETIVDAQVSYTFEDGTLGGLTILLQGNNLTDEPFVTTEEGDSRRVIDYQSYGPTYALGVSYKY